MSAIRLTPERYQAYLALRRHMLEDEPAAFLSSPADDRAQGLDEFTELMAQDENEIFVVEVEGVLVASSGIVRQQREKIRHRAHIWGVYCVPERRGHGYGRATMQGCIDRARSWGGVTLVTLSVSETGGAALRMYESLGFERWGTEPDAIRIGDASHAEHHLTLRL